MTRPRIQRITLAAIFLVALAASAFVLTRREPVPRDPAADLSVVILVAVVDENEDIYGFGHAFFVEPDLLATAWHVLTYASEAYFDLPDGRSVPVSEVVAEDVAADLLLVRVVLPDDVHPTPLRLARAASPGEVEIPVAWDWAGFRDRIGNVQSIFNDPFRGELLRLDSPLEPGLSGAPVLNRAGEVLGVCLMAESNHFAHYALAAGVSRLDALLRSGQRSSDVPFSEWVARPREPIDIGREAIWVGNEARRSGDLDAAIEAYRLAVEAIPEAPEAWVLLCDALVAARRYSDAAEAGETARRTITGRTGVEHNLLRAYIALERWPDAAALLRTLIADDPENLGHHLMLGMMLAKMGETDEAETILRHVEKAATQAERLDIAEDAAAALRRLHEPR